MANLTLVVCPSCLSELNVTHGLQVMEIMPKIVTADESLAIGVGICERTGHFIWRTTDGWQRRECDADVIHLGNEDVNEDDEGAEDA